MDDRHAAASEFLATETHARMHPQTAPSPEVLVIWESSNQSTAEISYAIAEVLRSRGVHVALADAAKAFPEREYDAYIVGSAIRHWRTMKHVKQFAHDARRTLLAHPVWLFSVLPIDHRPTPDDAPLDISDLFWCTAPQQHQMFAGKRDPADLTLIERAQAAILRIPYGDFRDWQAIRGWASEIATAVLAAGNQPGHTYRELSTVQGGQS